MRSIRIAGTLVAALLCGATSVAFADAIKLIVIAAMACFALLGAIESLQLGEASRADIDLVLWPAKLLTAAGLFLWGAQTLLLTIQPRPQADARPLEGD